MVYTVRVASVRPLQGAATAHRYQRSFDLIRPLSNLYSLYFLLFLDSLKVTSEIAAQAQRSDDFGGGS